MSNNSETSLIHHQSFETTGKIDSSSRNKANDSNPLNIQSVVLDKLLGDPDMQEVVVMEVLFLTERNGFGNFINFSMKNCHQVNYCRNYDRKLKHKAFACCQIG